jgi:Na+-driven multidrug efflux pump
VSDFGLGVAGAAVATITSQVAAPLAYAVYFRNGWGVVRVRLPRSLGKAWPRR